MNAANRSVLRQQRRAKRGATPSRAMPSRGAAFSSTVTRLPSRPPEQKVTQLNASRKPTPVWLRSLIVLQRCSDVLTFFLVLATLTVYSWTVYTQQQWAREYRQLETLQRDERHLTTTNEVIKDQLAQQAERPATGLVPPTQSNTIVLPPASQRQYPTPKPQTPVPEPEATTPLGY